MQNIQILSSEISDQIAAGEVVERPASVVKELIENAIDAGANHIQIFLDNGGKQRICVTDNGHGMTPENAQKSVLRHATSKVHSIKDLFALQSYGFRGEALAAISSISNLTLTTKHKEAETGTQIQINAGQQKTTTLAPHNTGTTIDIRDLFVATPARLQYLKKDETEYRYAVQEVTFAALSHPHINFEIIKNGSKTTQYTVSSEVDRIKNVLGKTADTLIPFSEKNSLMEASGYASAPGKCLSSRSRQYLFVNGRPVDDFRIAHAMRNAYLRTCGIEKHLHPAFVLFILIDPILVDVNVHPRKREVKFSDPQDVYTLVQHALSQAIEKTISPKNKLTQTQHNQHTIQSTQHNTPQTSFAHQYQTRSQSSYSPNQNQNNYAPAPSPFVVPQQTITPNQNTNLSPALRLIGQSRNRYIIAESPDGLYIFDQHALHERQRFERLYTQAMNKKVEQQKLLIPAQVPITQDESIILQENDAEMATIGIQCEYPNTKTVVITSLPQIIAHLDPTQIITDMITYFQEGSINEHTTEKILRRILEYRSCRGSVFFGDPMQPEEMQQLLNDFQSTKWKLLCPHGRPNHFFWPFDDLEKKFHR